MRKFIISDTHFNHQMLIDRGLRKLGYEKKLKHGLNGIKRDDILFHIGDIGIGQDAEVHKKWIKPLQYKKVLVMGNHDRKSALWYMNHGRDFACNSHIIHIDKYTIILTHEPIKPENLPEGWYNIHGHWHDRPLEPYTDRHFLYSPELEGYKPVELEKWFYNKLSLVVNNVNGTN